MTERLQQTVIAVTGASGFVGGALMCALAARGAQARGLVRGRGAAVPDGVVRIDGALEDDAALERLLVGSDAIIHCAAAVRAGSRAEFFRANSGGTERLLRARAAFAPHARFVLVSSLAARSPQISAYAASKRAAEESVARNPLGPRLIVRPPAVYGPGDRATMPVFRRLARGRLAMPAAPRARFSLLYVEDLAAALIHLLGWDGEWDGLTIELDDRRPNGYSWPELAQLASRRLGREVRFRRLAPPLLWPAAACAEAVGRIARRPPALGWGKLRELAHPDWRVSAPAPPALANWRPAVQFEEGFEQTLLWYKRQGWL